MIQHLRKIKKQSIFIIILGLLTTYFGVSQYIEAKDALGTLDQMILR